MFRSIDERNSVFSYFFITSHDVQKKQKNNIYILTCSNCKITQHALCWYISREALDMLFFLDSQIIQYGTNMSLVLCICICIFKFKQVLHFLETNLESCYCSTRYCFHFSIFFMIFFLYRKTIPSILAMNLVVVL